MNNPIAQIAALTCHANAHLAGKGGEKFFPGNTTAKFCDSIRFVEVKNAMTAPEETEVAPDPDDWFEYLAGAMDVRLWCDPGSHPPGMSDRMSAGMIGGGKIWTMEARYPKGSRYWVPRWDVWNQQAPQQRIWRVLYGRVASGPTRDVYRGSLQKVVPRLHTALRDAHAFANNHKLNGFADCFSHALETMLSGGKFLHGFHRDLAPEGVLPQEATMVLDACQSLWVFGGMGSWNDLGFDGAEQQVYEEVSDRLFNTACDAIAAAATASSAN